MRSTDTWSSKVRDLWNLRLDYINGEVNVKRRAADWPCPVVITCPRMADGGKYPGTEEQRQLLCALP